MRREIIGGPEWPPYMRREDNRRPERAPYM